MNHTTFYCTTYPSQVHQFQPISSYYPVNIPLCITITILVVLTITSNGMVLMAYYRTKSLQSITNMLLMSLAFSDLIVGLVAQPVNLTILIRNMLGKEPSCWLAMLSGLLVRFCGGVSMLTVSVIISLERYLAIIKPFFHLRFVTKTKAKLIIILLWLILITLNAILISGFADNLFFLFIAAFVVLGVTVVAFVSYKVVKKWRSSQGRAITLQQSTTVANARETRDTVAQRKDFKIALTVFYMTGAIFLCFTPLFVVSLYGQTNGEDQLYLRYFQPLSRFFVYLNSLLNPIIYCYRNDSFMNAICRMCSVRKPRRIQARSYNIEHNPEITETCNG